MKNYQMWNFILNLLFLILVHNAENRPLSCSVVDEKFGSMLCCRVNAGNNNCRTLIPKNSFHFVKTWPLETVKHANMLLQRFHKKPSDDSGFPSTFVSSDSFRRKQIEKEKKILSTILSAQKEKECCCEKVKEIIIPNEGYSLDKVNKHSIHQELPNRVQVIMSVSCVNSSCVQNAKKFSCRKASTYVPLYVVDKEFPDYLQEVPIEVNKDCNCEEECNEYSEHSAQNIKRELFKRFAKYDDISSHEIKEELDNMRSSMKSNVYRSHKVNNTFTLFEDAVKNFNHTYNKAAENIKLINNTTNKKYENNFFDAASLILIATKLLDFNISYSDSKSSLEKVDSSEGEIPTSKLSENELSDKTHALIHLNTAVISGDYESPVAFDGKARNLVKDVNESVNSHSDRLIPMGNKNRNDESTNEDNGNKIFGFLSPIYQDDNIYEHSSTDKINELVPNVTQTYSSKEPSTFERGIQTTIVKDSALGKFEDYEFQSTDYLKTYNNKSVFVTEVSVSPEFETELFSSTEKNIVFWTEASSKNISNSNINLQDKILKETEYGNETLGLKSKKSIVTETEAFTKSLSGYPLRLEDYDINISSQKSTISDEDILSSTIKTNNSNVEEDTISVEWKSFSFVSTVNDSILEDPVSTTMDESSSKRITKEVEYEDVSNNYNTKPTLTFLKEHSSYNESPESTYINDESFSSTGNSQEILLRNLTAQSQTPILTARSITSNLTHSTNYNVNSWTSEINPVSQDTSLYTLRTEDYTSKFETLGTEFEDHFNKSKESYYSAFVSSGDKFTEVSTMSTTQEDFPVERFKIEGAQDRFEEKLSISSGNITSTNSVEGAEYSKTVKYSELFSENSTQASIKDENNKTGSNFNFKPEDYSFSNITSNEKNREINFNDRIQKQYMENKLKESISEGEFNLKELGKNIFEVPPIKTMDSLTEKQVNTLEKVKNKEINFDDRIQEQYKENKFKESISEGNFKLKELGKNIFDVPPIVTMDSLTKDQVNTLEKVKNKEINFDDRIQGQYKEKEFDLKELRKNIFEVPPIITVDSLTKDQVNTIEDVKSREINFNDRTQEQYKEIKFAESISEKEFDLKVFGINRFEIPSTITSDSLTNGRVNTREDSTSLVRDSSVSSKPVTIFDDSTSLTISATNETVVSENLTSLTVVPSLYSEVSVSTGSEESIDVSKTSTTFNKLLINNTFELKYTSFPNSSEEIITETPLLDKIISDTTIIGMENNFFSNPYDGTNTATSVPVNNFLKISLNEDSSEEILPKLDISPNYTHNLVKNSEIKNAYESINYSKNSCNKYFGNCSLYCECCMNKESNYNTTFQSGKAANESRVKKQINMNFDNFQNPMIHFSETYNFLNSILNKKNEDKLEIILGKAENLLVLENELLRNKISLLKSMMKNNVPDDLGDLFTDGKLYKNSLIGNIFSYVIEEIYKDSKLSKLGVVNKNENIQNPLNDLRHDIKISPLALYTTEVLLKNGFINCRNQEFSKLSSLIAISEALSTDVQPEVNRLLKSIEDLLKSRGLDKFIHNLFAFKSEERLQLSYAEEERINNFKANLKQYLPTFDNYLQNCTKEIEHTKVLTTKNFTNQTTTGNAFATPAPIESTFNSNTTVKSSTNHKIESGEIYETEEFNFSPDKEPELSNTFSTETKYISQPLEETTSQTLHFNDAISVTHGSILKSITDSSEMPFPSSNSEGISFSNDVSFNSNKEDLRIINENFTTFSIGMSTTDFEQVKLETLKETVSEISENTTSQISTTDTIYNFEPSLVSFTENETVNVKETEQFTYYEDLSVPSDITWSLRPWTTERNVDLLNVESTSNWYLPQVDEINSSQTTAQTTTEGEERTATTHAVTSSKHIHISTEGNKRNVTGVPFVGIDRIHIDNPPSQYQPIDLDVNKVLKLIKREYGKQ